MNRKILAVVVIFLYTGLLYSQTAEQIIEKALKQSGYVSGASSYKSMKISGKMSMMGMDMPFTSYQKKPAFRMEMEMMNQKIISAFDGKEGWMINPMAGAKAQKMPESMLGQMKSQATMNDNPLAAFKEEGTTIEKLANEAVEGKDAFKLKMTKKDKSEQTIFVDAKSYLVLKINTKAEAMGQSNDVEMYFRDYKSVGAGQMPFLININSSGQEMKFVFDKFEPDAKLDDSLFKFPEDK